MSSAYAHATLAKNSKIGIENLRIALQISGILLELSQPNLNSRSRFHHKGLQPFLTPFLPSARHMGRHLSCQEADAPLGSQQVVYYCWYVPVILLQSCASSDAYFVYAVMACGGLATLEGPPPAINIFITNENWLLTCEAYDETSDIWEPLQDLPFKQNTTSIKLLLLPDGNVFATGTYYPKFSIVTYATKRLLVSAIYDPAEDSWEQTSVFPGHVHSSYQMIAL